MTNMQSPRASMTAFAMRKAAEGQDPAARETKEAPQVDLSQIPLTPEGVQENLKRLGYGSMAEPRASITSLAQSQAKQQEGPKAE